tara:strand:+ start:2704 stop:3099 length:396 start_codon:yes stop_codon:yes gene_type:complete
MSSIIARSAFENLKIRIDSDSESSSSDESISPRTSISPRHRLLRIQTGLSLRGNTPSPPAIDRRSPLRKVKSTPVLGISPRPECVLKRINTPIRKTSFLTPIDKREIEREIIIEINKLIIEVEKKFNNKTP